MIEERKLTLEEFANQFYGKEVWLLRGLRRKDANRQQLRSSGHLLFEGTPEEMVKLKGSNHTARFLAEKL